MFVKWGHHFISGKKGLPWHTDPMRIDSTFITVTCGQPAANQQPASSRQRCSRHTAEHRDDCSGWISLNVSGREEKDRKKEKKNKGTALLRACICMRRHLAFLRPQKPEVFSRSAFQCRRLEPEIPTIADMYLHQSKNWLQKKDTNPYEWIQVEGCESQRGGRRVIKSISYILKKRTPLFHRYDRIWMSPSKWDFFF